MTTKKLSRVISVSLVAFALAVLLALSSFAAYSVNLYGNVIGLDESAENTAAKYDFANDTWGEFTAIDSTTEFTSGVWGIKAGDAEPEAVFVPSSQNGQLSFWNTTTNIQESSIYTRDTEEFIQGKWTTLPGTSSGRVLGYAGTSYCSVMYDLNKTGFLTKTVVESTDDAGNVTTTETWVGSTTKTGEANLLQETVVRYTFTDEQILPAKWVNGWTIPGGFIVIPGSVALNTAAGYTTADVTGELRFYVKNLDGTVTKYVSATSGKVLSEIAAPAEMAESEGYLYAIELAPYATSPDDIIINNGSNTENAGYCHIVMNAGINTLDFTSELTAAPEGLITGFGVIGGLDKNATYELAPVTITSADTIGLIGDWQTYDPEELDLGGLYLIRETYNGIVSDTSYVYVYGSYSARAEFGTHYTTASGATTYLVTEDHSFTPGSFSGYLSVYDAAGKNSVMSHGQVSAGVMTNAYNGVEGALDTLAEKLNAIYIRYTLAQDEIIPVDQAKSFTINANQSNNFFKLSTAQTTKLVAYVADLSGKITTYEKEVTLSFSQTIKPTFDFTSFLPDEGYLVAFDFYPCVGVEGSQITSVTGTASFRYWCDIEPSYYVIDTPPALPVSGEKPVVSITTDGILKGLSSSEEYEYTVWSINGVEEAEWIDIPVGSTEYDFSDLCGLIAVRIKGDGYSSSGSEYALVYKPGAGRFNILHTTDRVKSTDGTTVVATLDVANAGTFAASANIPAKFSEGLWMGMGLSNSLAIDYNYSGYYLGTVSTPLGTRGLSELSSGTMTTQEVLDAYISKIYYTYGYLPEEIIKMEEFGSFKFQATVRQSHYSVSAGKLYSAFTLWVINDDEELEARTVYKQQYWYGQDENKAATVTLDDFTSAGIATDGYIVGIEIRPYAKGSEDLVMKTTGTTTNADLAVRLYESSYTANVVLDKEESTKGLTLAKGMVVGLDADKEYEYASYSVAGAIGEWTELTAETVIPEFTGLLAIRVKGDDIFTTCSDPWLIYNPASALSREELATVTDGKPAYYSPTNTTTPDWSVGKWTGNHLSWHDQTTGAYSFLDQSTGLGCNQVRTLWLYQVTEEEAEAQLAADALKDITTHWQNNNITSDVDTMQAVIDAHYAAEDYEETLEANKAAYQEKIAATMQTRHIMYAFDESDISPIDELLTISFAHKHRQGGFSFTATSAAVVVVMDVNGQTTEHKITGTTVNVTKGAWHKVNFDIQAAENLPTEGWIVGIKFYPYADVQADTIVANHTGRIDASNIAYSFEQQHVCIGYYYDSITVVRPPLDKPTVGYADGVVTGLDADKTYGYGLWTVNGVEETTEVTGVTEIALPSTGLWGVQLVSTDDDYTSSAFTPVYYKDMTDARENILHTEVKTASSGTEYTVLQVAEASKWNKDAGVSYNEGKWTGFSLTSSLALNYSSNKFTLGTTDTTVPASYAAAIYNAEDDEALAEARAEAEAAISTIYYSYAYLSEEIIPLNEFISWSFTIGERQGSLEATGKLDAKIAFMVITEDGELEERAVYKKVGLNTSTTVTASIDDIEDTTGYLVAVVVYPYSRVPEGVYLNCNASNQVTSHDFTLIPGSDYTVVPADPGSLDTPEISIVAKNAVITVDNYVAGIDYVWSADGGETWTAFSGSSFNAPYASKTYIVKSLANDFYEESAVSNEVVSPALTVVGRSLVLDGRIGIKVYLDIDRTIVKETSFTTTKVNSDYAYLASELQYGELYRVGGYATESRGCDWLTKIILDEATGYYYTIIYLPAKDLDNTSFEVDLGYYPVGGGSRVSINNMGYSFKTYIAQAKALAEAGDEAFVEALATINALEDYTAYADNYFDNGKLDEYISTAATDDVAAATRTNAELAGVTFYGTSLILEDQVTIRHYFAVSDINAFTAAYTCDIAYGTKGDYIYFDIEDIAAQNLGTQQTLTFKTTAGDVAYEINYSAANYMVDMMDDTDANLVSLVNAMYDYYLAAADYAK